jgi:hypothetical protein
LEIIAGPVRDRERRIVAISDDEAREKGEAGGIQDLVFAET